MIAEEATPSFVESLLPASPTTMATEHMTCSVALRDYDTTGTKPELPSKSSSVLALSPRSKIEKNLVNFNVLKKSGLEVLLET